MNPSDQSLTPFFVHIPKNMGNFIYQKYYGLKQDDKTRLYGLYDSLYDYYTTHGIAIDTGAINHPSVSIDHLTPLELLNLGIITPTESAQHIYFAIMREPMERFISLCNYWDVPPIQLIYNMTKMTALKRTKYNLFQHFRPQSDYINDIVATGKPYRIFSIHQKKEMRDFLSVYFPDKDSIDMEEKIYPSRNKYHLSMVSRENLHFLQKYYREDIARFYAL
jgi:hypothetical protein